MGWNNTLSEAQPLHLGNALLQLVDGTQLSCQAYFPDGHQIIGHRLVQITGCQSHDGCQVGGRLVQIQSADNIDVCVTGGHFKPPTFFQHSQQHSRTVVVKSVAGPAGIAGRGSHHQCLDLRQNGSHALHHTGHASARRVIGAAGQQHFRRIFHLRQALVPHLKDADLVGGAEAVFRRPQDAVGRVLVSLKVQHTVHHMFQYLGARDRTLLIDMADDEHGNAPAFGKLHQRHGTVFYLADAARR